jgi:hypothetical protein
MRLPLLVGEGTLGDERWAIGEAALGRGKSRPMSLLRQERAETGRALPPRRRVAPSLSRTRATGDPRASWARRPSSAAVGGGDPLSAAAVGRVRRRGLERAGGAPPSIPPE